MAWSHCLCHPQPWKVHLMSVCSWPVPNTYSVEVQNGHWKHWKSRFNCWGGLPFKKNTVTAVFTWQNLLDRILAKEAICHSSQSSSTSPLSSSLSHFHHYYHHHIIITIISSSPLSPPLSSSLSTSSFSLRWGATDFHAMIMLSTSTLSCLQHPLHGFNLPFPLMPFTFTSHAHHSGSSSSSLNTRPTHLKPILFTTFLPHPTYPWPHLHSFYQIVYPTHLSNHDYLSVLSVTSSSTNFTFRCSKAYVIAVLTQAL